MSVHETVKQTAYTYQGPLDLGGAAGEHVPPAQVPTGFVGFLNCTAVGSVPGQCTQLGRESGPLSRHNYHPLVSVNAWGGQAGYPEPDQAPSSTTSR